MFKLFFSVMINELKQMVRVREISAVLIVGMVIYFFLYPLPYNNEEVREIPVVVMDQDNTTMSREFLRMVNASDALKIADYVENLGEAKELLKQRKVYGILIVPFNFEQNVLKGHRDAIVFYGDASYVMIYNGAATSISTIAQTMNKNILVDRQISMGVDPSIAKGNSAPFQPVFVQLFNPQGGYATYVIPPAFVLILHQSLWMGIMLACILSRNSKFDQSLVANNQLSIGKLSFITLFGKYAAYLFYSSFFFWIFMLFLPYWYQLPQLGAIFSVGIMGFFFLSSIILLALAMSSLFKKMDNVFLLMLPFSMIFFFLSGMSWPHYLMPDLFIRIAEIFPAMPAISGLVRLNQMGATLTDVAKEILNLSILIIVYGLAAYYVTYRYIERLKKK